MMRFSLCLLLVPLSCLLPAKVEAASGFRSGFEADEPAASWMLKDHGISAVTGTRAHAGKRCLRIVDPDEKVGSNVLSAPLAVERDKVCFVSMWLFLEKGDPNGLGVYLNFLDADGKRLAQASERSAHRPPMRLGRWTSTLFTVTPPKAATQVQLWLHTFSAAVVTCCVDDVQVELSAPEKLGPAAEWQGGTLDAVHHKAWPYGLRWDHGESPALTREFPKSQDWTSYSGVRFWMYCARPGTSTFVLIFNSENKKTEGPDYYSLKVALDWQGWKQFTVPFHELGRAREPMGWNRIDNVVLTASGWGQTLNPKTVVTLDGWELLTKAETPLGGLPSDETFFRSLNLDLPGLRAVKDAVDRGDMPAARQALARHLRDRTHPKWLFDWREAPLRDVKVPGPQADRAPDQWDYYSTFLTIDWQGWKKFTLKKSDFSPRALVEGQGWKGKKPIGWNWIHFIALNAKGWGLTPDPNTVLYFDDVRLVGKGKPYVISDFEGTSCPWTGLELSSEKVRSGKGSGKWANQVLTTGIRCVDIPHDWTDYDALEFWVYSEKATGSRVVIVLDSDVPRGVAAAEKILRHQFDYTEGPGKKGTIDFGPKIDWTANPTQGEARTHLWNESLNRHFHFRTLARAYWDTGQDKYAKEIADEILDWTASMPRPLLSDGNRVGHYAWQTLTTGIRLADTWPEALYRCLGSPTFTPEVLTAMMKSIGQQARHLVKWPSTGNWLTAESNGLFTAGMLFPEFKEAKEWRRIALERLYGQLDDEVYPDGMEYELATGYNNWVVSEFAHILQLCDLNDLRGELPKDFQARMEKMFNYQLLASMPNGACPGLNDSGNSDVRRSLATGYKLFPRREDFLYVSTSGAHGRRPAETSHAFPWCGHYIMRSGWDADATYLLFDAGPFGYGHQHEDKLHFVLWAHGRQQVLDPGNFSYDHSRWRRYVLSTRGHNTVLVDGQDQHRRGKRETYFRRRPWRGRAPADNDAKWESTPDYDFASGIYAKGYGSKNDIHVVHSRCILYLKHDDLFVILDTLSPADKNLHTYEALFHLDADSARVEAGHVVRTQNPKQSNLVIVPAGVAAVEIVKGKTDEPVQGWANGPWRPIPTAIYRTQGTGVVRMAFVLAPVARGAKPKVKSVAFIPGVPGGVALRIVLADGSARMLIVRDHPATAVRVAGIDATRQVTLAEVSKEGKTTSTWSFTPKAP